MTSEFVAGEVADPDETSPRELLAAGQAAGQSSVEPPVQPALQHVAQAQLRLELLDGQPVAGHIETYEGVHAVLQDALAELDEA